MEKKEQQATEGQDKGAAVKTLFTMILVMLPDGNVEIKGPLANKPVCKGMLAAAEELVNTFQPKVQVVSPQAILPQSKNIKIHP